jgi:hypothetical protein
MCFRFLLVGVLLLVGVSALQQPQRPNTISLSSTTAATATLLEAATLTSTTSTSPADSYSLPVPPPAFELPLWKLALAGSLATMGKFTVG